MTIEQHLRMVALAEALDEASQDLIAFHCDLNRSGELSTNEAYHLQGASRTLRLAYVHCKKLGEITL